MSMTFGLSSPVPIKNFSALFLPPPTDSRLEDVNVDLREIAESDRAELQELLTKFTELKQNHGFGNLLLSWVRNLFQSQYSAENLALARKQEIAEWLPQYAELIREAALLGKSATALTERIRAGCNKDALSSNSSANSPNNQEIAIRSQEQLIWMKHDLTAIDVLTEGFNKTDRALQDFKPKMIDLISQALGGSQNLQVLDHFNHALENLKQKLINAKDQLENEKTNLIKKETTQIKEEIKVIQKKFDSLKLLPLPLIVKDSDLKDRNFNWLNWPMSANECEKKIRHLKEICLTLGDLKDNLFVVFQRNSLIGSSIASSLKKEIADLQKQLDTAEKAQLQALEKLQLPAIQAQSDEKGFIEILSEFQGLIFHTIKEKDKQLYVLNAEGREEAIDEKMLETVRKTIKTLHHLKKSLLKKYSSKISKNPAGDIICYLKKDISQELRKKITYFYKHLDKVEKGVTCIHGLLKEKLHLSNELMSFATNAVYQKVMQEKIEDVYEKVIDAQCSVNLMIAKIKYFSLL